MRAMRLLLLSVVVVFALALSGCGLLSGGDTDTTTDDGGTSETRDDVKVTLSWDDPVDMDLEIWDADGQNALFPASAYAGEDVTDGSGDEFFEFKQYGAEDFSAGKYVVSVFFAARSDDSAVDSVTVTLTVDMPDGGSTVRTGTIYWETGRDQWHAFQIDAATGAMEDIDQLVEIETTQ